MANIKSAKKRAKQNEKRRIVNASRRSAIKSSTKGLIDAIAQGKDVETLKTLLKDVEAKVARAKNKHVMHKNAAARKVSRLAKRVQAFQKTGAKAA
ncbi:MAG TPA: 30S ribosomal protein S20 [Candidatus Dependentiae bacterium]|jgi:small subunit ribosomal protein S20|nr:30S ribosomal protein S20 [Candidatus Dependentiae bacterium]